ncbi:MAG TPA: VWA domain-containing protein [Aestuariivirgaceae bacterium]|nr:VWA domain-containing protein [Aestuariivirgaceae bacterium]
MSPAPPPAPSGKLAENIMHFARMLRKAGLPVGPGAVVDALEAVQSGALTSRQDFYWALHSVFVTRHEHDPLYDQAFHVFWRNPRMAERLMHQLLQQVRVPAAAPPKTPGQRRLAEAMYAPASDKSRQAPSPKVLELEAQFTASRDEVLRRKDFEQMTAEEEARARAAIAALRLHRTEVRTRRFEPSSHGTSIDMRRTIAASMRRGGHLVDLARRRRRRREPPLVVIADISGSMSNYSRIFLHFVHALMSDRDRVHVFLFGTRLTNVTREVRRRDVDEALAKVAGAVQDWSGGTRIGQCLREFNFRWSRRVLAQGAHVLLMTDGLERDDTELLGREMARLRRAARRIVWLNPLLRYDGFAPLAAGVRAILPNVDEFRPVHNLDSLEDLARALSNTSKPSYDPRRWMEAKV